jgi:hypothetical protein
MELIGAAGLAALSAPPPPGLALPLGLLRPLMGALPPADGPPPSPVGYAALFFFFLFERERER